MKINRKTFKRNMSDVRRDKRIIRRYVVNGCALTFHKPNGNGKRNVRKKILYMMKYILPAIPERDLDEVYDDYEQ